MPLLPKSPLLIRSSRAAPYHENGSVMISRLSDIETSNILIVFSRIIDDATSRWKSELLRFGSVTVPELNLCTIVDGFTVNIETFAENLNSSVSHSCPLLVLTAMTVPDYELYTSVSPSIWYVKTSLTSMSDYRASLFNRWGEGEN